MSLGSNPIVLKLNIHYFRIIIFYSFMHDLSTNFLSTLDLRDHLQITSRFRGGRGLKNL